MVPVRSGKPLGTEITVVIDPIIIVVCDQLGSVTDSASELPAKTKAEKITLERIILTWTVKNNLFLVRLAFGKNANAADKVAEGAAGDVVSIFG